MNARPSPRKSSLAGTSPVAPAVEPAAAAQQPEQNPSELRMGDVGRGKAKVSFYQDRADTERLRSAVRCAMAQEGARGLSDFIHNVLMREVERLEQRYNDGQPFDATPPGVLASGRRMGE